MNFKIPFPSFREVGSFDKNSDDSGWFNFNNSKKPQNIVTQVEMKIVHGCKLRVFNDLISAHEFYKRTPS